MQLFKALHRLPSSITWCMFITLNINYTFIHAQNMAEHQFLIFPLCISAFCMQLVDNKVFSISISMSSAFVIYFYHHKYQHLNAYLVHTCKIKFAVSSRQHIRAVLSMDKTRISFLRISDFAPEHGETQGGCNILFHSFILY